MAQGKRWFFRSLAGALVLALWGGGRAHADFYAYAYQQVSGFTFTGANITTALSSNTTTSAVQSGVPNGVDGHVNLTDALQAYVGPAGTAPPENSFGQKGQVNPDYVRGDVQITPVFTISNVAEGDLGGIGDSAAVGAWSVSAQITLTTASTVTLGFNYANLLSIVNAPPPNLAGSVTASYAFDFNIQTLGGGGTIVFDATPTQVNNSIGLTSPGSTTIGPNSGNLSITSTILPAGTYQATIVGSERVFLSARAVPEPGSLALLGIGSAGLFGLFRRRRRTA